MPIAGNDSSSLVRIVGQDDAIPVLPKYEEPAYIPVFAESSTDQIKRLAAYVEGYTWIIKEYYSRVLTRDTALSGQQVTQSGTLMQYNRIDNLKIKVSTPLEPTQDNETKVMSYQGAGTVFGGLIPNEGDMFIAEIAPGELAVFHVSSSIKKSVQKVSVYEIAYMVDHTEQHYIDDLRSKAIAEYVYVEKPTGEVSFITTSQYAAFESLKRVYRVRVREYFEHVYSPIFNTFLVLGQTETTLDPFLTRFYRRAFEINDSPRLSTYTSYEFNSPLLKESSIYDRIVERSTVAPSVIGMGLLECSAINPDYTPMIGPAIETSGINYVIYPLTIKTRGITTRENIAYVVNGAITLDGSSEQGVGVPYNYNSAALSSAVIGPIDITKGYVLSKAYYDGDTANYTEMDQVVASYLSGQALDIAGIYDLLNKSREWPDLCYQYYVPIILYFARLIIMGAA